MLAIFPALLVVVSVLGMIGNSVTDPLLTNLQDVAPGPAQEIFTNAIASGIVVVPREKLALRRPASRVGERRVALAVGCGRLDGPHIRRCYRDVDC